jgi:putative ABC transport system substrate-binding protein
MRRREFITLLGGAAASTAHPSYIRAQQPEQVRRIGLLMGWAESDPAVKSYVAAFRGALAKLGWTDDTKLRIELRWSAGSADGRGIGFGRRPRRRCQSPIQ